MKNAMREIGNGLADVWKHLRTNLRARARLRRQQRSKARNLQLKYVTPEQLAYAELLDTGVTIGRYFLGGLFILYVFEFAAPKIPLSELPLYWSMSADQYSNSVGVGLGWSWLKLVGHGDYMNFLGIVFLASLTIVCYLRVLPDSFRRKDFSSSVILSLEVAMLMLAASGLLAFGH
jgi:hypothetical protein